MFPGTVRTWRLSNFSKKERDPQIFGLYMLLTQKRLKLRTSNLAYDLDYYLIKKHMDSRERILVSICLFSTEAGARGRLQAR